ncbi:hypothetical protein BGX24_001139 [Mortierella sp. AD032]|nr:hypothetical protein BGX24_001139 [Mortierella sp. AD032]
MSRVPKPSTWSPPTSPEVEVKLEKASTKERTLSPEFVSASARDSRSKDHTPATPTTTPLTPRSTPAFKNMSTFESLQTLRRCDGTASNGSQCVTERNTGYPDDIPFFCKRHIKQADSYAASSPIIPTPAASPEVESRDKDSVQDQGEEIHQDDQSRSADTMRNEDQRGIMQD